jgi:hypothetical protein
MKVKMIFSLFSLVLVTNVSFSECANPKRTVYAHAFPASMTTVVLSNPSRVSQKVCS